MQYSSWNDAVKLILKSEMVRRGITNEKLALLLNETYDANETKLSIESKIYRGTFSAVFLFQCLNAIGCKSIETTIEILKPTKKKKTLILKFQQ